MKIQIIGDGTVGKSFGRAIGIEPIGPGDETVEATVVYICVPTPTIKGKQDLSAVKQAISRVKADLIVIRSTVLPGTTEKLEKDIPMIFMPEFGKEVSMDRDMAHPRVYILGTTEKSKHLVNLAVMALPMTDEIRVTTSTVAECVKYFSNIWKFSQVMIANSLYDWRPDEYQDVIDNLLILDDIPQWGWDVKNEGYRGASGKCLPKDFGAALGNNKNKLWQEMEDYNGSLLSGS